MRKCAIEEILTRFFAGSWLRKCYIVESLSRLDRRQGGLFVDSNVGIYAPFLSHLLKADQMAPTKLYGTQSTDNDHFRTYRCGYHNLDTCILSPYNPPVIVIS